MAFLALIAVGLIIFTAVVAAHPKVRAWAFLGLAVLTVGGMFAMTSTQIWRVKSLVPAAPPADHSDAHPPASNLTRGVGLPAEPPATFAADHERVNLPTQVGQVSTVSWLALAVGVFFMLLFIAKFGWIIGHVPHGGFLVLVLGGLAAVLSMYVLASRQHNPLQITHASSSQIPAASPQVLLETPREASSTHPAAEAPEAPEAPKIRRWLSDKTHGQKPVDERPTWLQDPAHETNGTYEAVVHVGLTASPDEERRAVDEKLLAAGREFLRNYWGDDAATRYPLNVPQMKGLISAVYQETQSRVVAAASDPVPVSEKWILLDIPANAQHEIETHWQQFLIRDQLARVAACCAGVLALLGLAFAALKFQVLQRAGGNKGLIAAGVALIIMIAMAGLFCIA
ncbi:MAG TPA: hypothetical protein VFE24_12365 [Pirellulales bacterium]|jgi:hypothetical protein|nr:hypothetical protein [Pirellulales bacterium]